MSEPRSDIPQKKSVGFQTVIGVAYAALGFVATTLFMTKVASAKIAVKDAIVPLAVSSLLMGWSWNKAAKEHNHWVDRVEAYEKERQDVSRKLGEIGQGLGK